MIRSIGLLSLFPASRSARHERATCCGPETKGRSIRAAPMPAKRLGCIMPLRCNLDARGKRLRMVYGMFFMIGGIVLLFLWRSTTGRIVEVLMILAGGFMIF